MRARMLRRDHGTQGGRRCVRNGDRLEQVTETETGTGMGDGRRRDGVACGVQTGNVGQ